MTLPGPQRVVTIDGPAGAGKSTVARGLAAELGFRHLDTGSMYRAVAFAFLEQGVAITPGPALEHALAALELRVLEPGAIALGARELRSELRSAAVDGAVSDVAAIPAVRRKMVALQRAQVEFGPLVAEGRDMGSVVFPQAAWKFYLDASAEERARRRARDYATAGRPAAVETILAAIRERDRIDSSRADSPLVCPEGALRVDTDPLSAAEVIALLAAHVRRG